MASKKLSFLKRANLTRHKMAQRLFKIMEDKKSNLALAADVHSQKELLALAGSLGPYICVLKTHVDILNDFTADFGPSLKKLSQKHNFLIFEDRKFADIGQTVFLQYTQGIYKIAEWADIINAHIIPGVGIIEALRNSNLLLLAEMSSSGTLAKGAYARKALQLGEKYPETVMGFICLKKLSRSPGMIHFTPGVKMDSGKDSLGQKYRTIDEVLTRNQSDLIIVGRDITNALDPIKQAKLYQKKAWDAYLKTT